MKSIEQASQLYYVVAVILIIVLTGPAKVQHLKGILKIPGLGQLKIDLSNATAPSP